MCHMRSAEAALYTLHAAGVPLHGDPQGAILTALGAQQQQLDFLTGQPPLEPVPEQTMVSGSTTSGAGSTAYDAGSTTAAKGISLTATGSTVSGAGSTAQQAGPGSSTDQLQAVPALAYHTRNAVARALAAAVASPTTCYTSRNCCMTPRILITPTRRVQVQVHGDEVN